MERIEGDNKITYKKTGGGCLRWGKLLIKPGQVIRLDPNQVPENFKDVLIPLEHIREPSAPPVNVAKTEYFLKNRGKSKSLFDVVYKIGVDDKGKDILKAMNGKVLDKATAENLLAELQK